MLLLLCRSIIIVILSAATLLAEHEISKDCQTFEPKAERYDWIELTSGEWLKGELRSLNNKRVEFDSDKLNMQTFDFKDIRKIRLHRQVSINIYIPDSVGAGYFGYQNRTRIMTGFMRLDGDNVIMVVDDEQFSFPREQLISIAYDAETSLDYWSGKITFSFDVRTGNSERFDYTARALVKRRTTETRLVIDYFGNILSTNKVETTNDHRIKEVFDVYLTDKVYITPIYAEYYRDLYQNIRDRYTVGFGLGYTIIDNSRIEWDIGGGPGYLYIRFDTVEAGREHSSKSFAMAVQTVYDMELTEDVEFIFNYGLTYSNKETGGYKHHMITTVENSLTGWLDIDISLVWDYISYPEKNSDGDTPYKSDVQLLVGMGIEF